ncbi:MAG: hypothetical protein KIS94_15815 [Chitinophagales bacterium]|nr:hypothetical protein [Chitinophagales bacterium]
MEEQEINETNAVAEKKKRKSSLGSMLGAFDSVGEKGLKRVLFNLPLLLFLAALAVLHIANNHLAESYARRIALTENEVKQLRWQYMTTAAALMKKSKQSEVAKLVGTQGLKELRVPPYKIEVKKN